MEIVLKERDKCGLFLLADSERSNLYKLLLWSVLHCTRIEGSLTFRCRSVSMTEETNKYRRSEFEPKSSYNNSFHFTTIGKV